MIKSILLKRGIRSDRFLTRSLLKLPFLRSFIVALDTYALLQSQYWPSEEIKAVQLERIRDILIHAKKKVPFWSDKLAAAEMQPEDSFKWDDLLRIPVTYKTDFKRKPVTYFTDQDLFAQDHITFTTSGSTAEPLEFFHDYDCELRSFAICRRMFVTVSGGKFLPVIHIRARHRYGFSNKNSWWFYAYNSNHLKYRIEKLYQLAQSLKRHFILYSFSSYVIETARLCSERKIPFRPVAIIVVGEAVRPSEKEFVESRLGTKVFNCYVTNELGWLAFDCKNHNLHINSEWAYIEIVDKEGTPLENGKEGRVIVTTFDNKIMPFIRYDVGDLGMISREPCACGKTSPVIKIVGRQTDVITLPDNRRVPLLDILGVFWRRFAFIRQYQIIQKSLDEIIVKIIPEGASIENDQLIEIANHLRRNLHSALKIEFEIVKDIPAAPSGKKIYFKPLV